MCAYSTFELCCMCVYILMVHMVHSMHCFLTVERAVNDGKEAQRVLEKQMATLEADRQKVQTIPNPSSMTLSPPPLSPSLSGRGDSDRSEGEGEGDQGTTHRAREVSCVLPNAHSETHKSH